jgi:hypothetical protein|tara:strand:- start:611 stop:928 length:318 start_codon:yes stop_codon:yes gene_type:complete
VEHNKKDDGVISSIALIIDQNGNLQLDRSKINIGSLRDKLVTMFPNWKHEQETINACRWIDDLINKTHTDIEKEFGTYESISVQRQSLYDSSHKSRKKLGDNKEV